MIAFSWTSRSAAALERLEALSHLLSHLSISPPACKQDQASIHIITGDDQACKRDQASISTQR